MRQKVWPFLMFQGQAEAAMTFYVSLFPDSAIVDMARYGPGEAAAESTVMRATFSVGGQRVMCIDSPVKHGFTFTPASSLFVEGGSEGEIRRLADALAEGGMTLMPLGSYGFSRQYAWPGSSTWLDRRRGSRRYRHCFT